MLQKIRNTNSTAMQVESKDIQLLQHSVTEPLLSNTWFFGDLLRFRSHSSISEVLNFRCFQSVSNLGFRFELRQVVMVRTCVFYSFRKLFVSNLPKSVLFSDCSNANKIFHRKTPLTRNKECRQTCLGYSTKLLKIHGYYYFSDKYILL